MKMKHPNSSSESEKEKLQQQKQDVQDNKFIKNMKNLRIALEAEETKKKENDSALSQNKKLPKEFRGDSLKPNELKPSISSKQILKVQQSTDNQKKELDMSHSYSFNESVSFNSKANFNKTEKQPAVSKFFSLIKQISRSPTKKIQKPTTIQIKREFVKKYAAFAPPETNQNIPTCSKPMYQRQKEFREKLRDKRGKRFLIKLKEKAEHSRRLTSHPNYAGYQKYVEENPKEKNAEYFLEGQNDEETQVQPPKKIQDIIVAHLEENS